MTIRGLLIGAALGLSACRSPAQTTATPAGTTPALEQEVRTLHSAMVAAFKRDPVSVAQFYTDDASIMGGGARSVGREQIERYWREGPQAAEWTLEVLEVGGDLQSPWVRGRSTLSSTSGRRMVTDYVGILKRGKDGQLRFYVDMFVGAPGMVMRPSGGSPR